mgnify:CR=1 FL=1
MNYRSEIAHLVSEALKQHDRYTVAAEMSRLTGFEVSKNMLDAWSAESREGHNLPLYLAPVLEVATTSTVFVEWCAGVRGGQVLFGQETRQTGLGRLENVRLQAEEAAEHIKRQLQGVNV